VIEWRLMNEGEVERPLVVVGLGVELSGPLLYILVILLNIQGCMIISLASTIDLYKFTCWFIFFWCILVQIVFIVKIRGIIFKGCLLSCLALFLWFQYIVCTLFFWLRLGPNFAPSQRNFESTTANTYIFHVKFVPNQFSMKFAPTYW
jgi:hypothetical protein